jgi:hypothetical protein
MLQRKLIIKIHIHVKMTVIAQERNGPSAQAGNSVANEPEKGII